MGPVIVKAELWTVLVDWTTCTYGLDHGLNFGPMHSDTLNQLSKLEYRCCCSVYIDIM